MCIVTYENINCLIYTSTLTLKQHLNDVFLKVDKNNKKMNEPKWMTSKINRLQRDIAHTHLIMKPKASNNFTNNQNHILKYLKKKFGNKKVRTLTYNVELLKHELKTTSVYLNYLIKTNKRKCINRQFISKQKAVYCSFCYTNTTANKIPTHKKVESYWSKIWGEKANYNYDAPWIKLLQNEYCSNVIQDNNCYITIAM